MSSLLDALGASASALEVQRARMEVAISNLANAESTRGPDGGPYRRREIIVETTPEQHFGATLGRVTVSGVRVTSVVEDQTPFRRRYEPSHPDADAAGFVAMPNVDVPEEMVDMLGAARAYQANITAIGLIRDTLQKALDLAK